MNEIQNCMERLKDVGLSESITQKLVEVLKDNPYAKVFRSLKDLQSIEDDVHIHLATNVQVDQRVYNLPGVDQVAAIWIEENNNIQFKRDTVVHAHLGKRHRI